MFVFVCVSVCVCVSVFWGKATSIPLGNYKPYLFIFLETHKSI